MFARVESLARRIGRSLTRSEWLVRALRLHRSPDTAGEPGLVVLQIDGLSRTQLERAVRKGKMPFVKRLMEREHYDLHSHYSGVPSTTPAVQGEIFYGVPRAVPSFNFHDRTTGRDFKMYEPEDATEIEERLGRHENTPLLKDGSVYASIYGKNADEEHYCATRFGVGPMFRQMRLLPLIAFIFLNIPAMIRVAILVVIEVLLAFWDLFTGTIRGQDFTMELKFVPTRVAICIGLREMVTLGVQVDAARGRRVVYANYLGYDEQSHRRGPDSAFAHWTLRGIDHCIKRVWLSAHRSAYRDYDVYILSDHGQENSLSYPEMQGESIQAAVQRVLGEDQEPDAEPHTQGIQLDRARLIGARILQKFLKGTDGQSEVPRKTCVTAMGPIGHVYLPFEADEDRKAEIARKLVRDACVPLAAFSTSAETARAFTVDGEYTLPEDNSRVFGPDHPFLACVGGDFTALCAHENAGDIVIAGWRFGHQPMSFSNENGAHGGAGPEETRAFALLPPDASIPTHNCEGEFLRPVDIRHAALRFLGNEPLPERSIDDEEEPAARTLRVMTWNVHSCIGMDGKISPHRIARTIARYDPDVVGLQEVDVNRTRTSGHDQARLVARYLRMDHHFHPVVILEEEHYGDAILSRFPMRLVKADALSTLPDRPRLEPRGALWVEIDWDGTKVQVLNTHLGLRPSERKIQTRDLAGEDWLESARARGPVIFCGDLNAQPGSAAYQTIAPGLNDVQNATGNGSSKTWPTRLPMARIDHMFTSEHFRVDAVRVPRNHLTLAASDHLPLIADLTVKES